MSKSTLKIKQIFYFSYFLMLFSWMFESVTYIKEILPFIRYTSYALATIVITYNYKKFSLKKIIVNIFITILIIVSSILSDTNIILSLWLFVLASENSDIKELVKVDLYTKFIFVLLIIALHYCGLTEQKQFLTYFGEIRNALGFGKPNTFGYYVFSICADFVYLKSNKFNMFHLILLIIISMFVANVSLSRTSSYLIIVLGIMSCFFIVLKKIVLSNLFKKVMLTMFVLLSILSFVVAKNYSSSNELYSKVNAFFSGRIINAKRYINNYDIKLFGQPAQISNYSGTSNIYLDNAYLKLLICNGLISYILILIIYTKVIKKAYEFQNPLLVSIIFIYLIYGISENAMFWITGNVFLLYSNCKNDDKIKEKNVHEKI